MLLSKLDAAGHIKCVTECHSFVFSVALSSVQKLRITLKPVALLTLIAVSFMLLFFLYSKPHWKRVTRLIYGCDEYHSSRLLLRYLSVLDQK